MTIKGRWIQHEQHFTKGSKVNNLGSKVSKKITKLKGSKKQVKKANTSTTYGTKKTSVNRVHGRCVNVNINVNVNVNVNVDRGFT